MARDGTVTVRITGDTSGLTRALGDTDTKMSKLGGVAKKGLAVTAGAVAAFAANGAKSFSEFQGQMNEVFTLLPGISKKEMGKMSGDVKNFAKEFGVLPDKVVPALYQAISAGVPKENVFTFLETAQKAAKGGVTDLETAVDGISSVVNAYGADVIDAAKASDLMFTAVKGGKTNFTQLSQSLFNVIPTAASLGVQFGDVTAALATMTAQGTPTSVATTQLRQLFVELSKDGSKLAGTFQEISGKSFKQFIAEGGNTQGALQLLEKHVDGFGSTSAKVIGDLGKHFKNANGDMKKFEIAAGQSLKGTGIASKDLFADFKKLTGEGIRDFMKSGKNAGPVFAQMAKDAASADGSLSDLFGSVEAGNAALALTGAGTKKFNAELQASGTAAGAADQAFATMDSGMGSTMEKLKARVKVLSIDVGEKIASIGPMWLSLGLQAAASSGKVLTAFGAMVAGAAHASLSAVGAIARFIAHWVMLGAQSLIHAAKVAAAWLIALGPIGLVVAAVIAAVGLIVIHWEKISAAAAAVWNWLKTNWPLILAVLTGPFGLAVLAIVKNWDTIKDGAAAVKDWVVARFGDIVGFVTGLPGKIGGAASGMFDGFKDAFKAAMNWIVDKWNDFKIPAVRISAFGATQTVTPEVNFPNINRFHSGGIVPGRPGSEVLGLLEAGEHVIARSGAGTGGGPVNHYTIAVTAIDPAAASAAVIAAIREYEQRNGTGWRAG